MDLIDTLKEEAKASPRKISWRRLPTGKHVAVKYVISPHSDDVFRWYYEDRSITQAQARVYLKEYVSTP